jgi:ribulose-5-phosphate 4-epimerase/fuculose-1-phosphate aldolase
LDGYADPTTSSDCSGRTQHLHPVQVTGTGGGTSIRDGERIYIAPSGVQKELMKPQDLFVMDYATREYLRRPPVSNEHIFEIPEM